MTGRRTRSETPVSCDCARTRHEHGTRVMYQRHGCGCDPCYAASSAYTPHTPRDPRPTPDTAQPAPAITGLFVATFPYYGGLSPQHLRRVLRMKVAALAEEQGARLLVGDLRVRMDRTGAGYFVSVAVPAESSAPMHEVQRRAAELAWRHEQAHPRLARSITRSLEGVAA